MIFRGVSRGGWSLWTWGETMTNNDTSARDFLTAALSQYRRGEENHSADELHVLTAGGPTIAQRHRAVMRHFRDLDARRLP